MTAPTSVITDEMIDRAFAALTWRQVPASREDVRTVLEVALAGRAVVDADTWARMVLYRRDTLGMVCPQGHHTRFVDVLGDPNADEYVCAHCAVRSDTVVARACPRCGQDVDALPVGQACDECASAVSASARPPGRIELADRFGGAPR